MDSLNKRATCFFLFELTNNPEAELNAAVSISSSLSTSSASFVVLACLQVSALPTSSGEHLSLLISLDEDKGFSSLLYWSNGSSSLLSGLAVCSVISYEATNLRKSYINTRLTV